MSTKEPVDGPSLVSASQVRNIARTVLKDVPMDFYNLKESVGQDDLQILEIIPVDPDALRVRVEYGVSGLDIVLGDSAAVEVSAPFNVNYGPPNRSWQQDLTAILAAVVEGAVVLTLMASGAVASVRIPGSRLGVGRFDEALIKSSPPAWPHTRGVDGAHD